MSKRINRTEQARQAYSAQLDKGSRPDMRQAKPFPSLEELDSNGWQGERQWRRTVSNEEEGRER